MIKQNVSVLVTDLDNTLFDWVDIWYRSFKPMLDKIVEISQIDEQTIRADIKRVFEKHGTSEYSMVIQEMDCLKQKHNDKSAREIVSIYEDAIKAYNEGRKSALALYPSVIGVLAPIVGPISELVFGSVSCCGSFFIDRF